MKNCFKKSALNTIDGIPVFSQPDQYIENYNLIAGDHVSAITDDKDNPWIAKQVWDQMEAGTLRLVLKHLEDGNNYRILDVGVGLGRLLDKIRSSYPGKLDLYGMDIALPYLRHALSKNLNVVLSKIEDMPYKDEYFDMIVCTDVLEHVEDLNFCVKKILDCLKPGGILIVRVPNREDLSSYLKPDYPYFMAHVRGFDQYALELLFTRVFRHEFVEKSQGLLMENYSLLKCKIPIKGYNRFLRSFLHVSKVISNKWYEQLLKIFYHPVEINTVIRKALR